VASGRIPIQALLAAIEADDDEELDDEEALADSASNQQQS
jgi:hypothetical protein